MYCFLIFLFFFIPFPVLGETIYTPYYETKNQNDFEKMEVETLYLLEENQIPTKHYYLLEEAPSNFVPIWEDFIYTSYSSLQKNCKEKEHQEIQYVKKYWYQNLKEVSSISLKSSHSIFLKQLQVEDKNQQILFLEKEPVYLLKDKEFKIVLPKKMQLEDLFLSILVFIAQGDQNVFLEVFDQEKLAFQKIPISKKGYVSIQTSLSKNIHHYKWGSIKTSTSPPNYYYSNVIREETLCQIRKKKYRFQKKAKQIISSEAQKEGYHLLKILSQKKYLKRKKIVLKDPLITHTPYLLIDDFVLETSFPLKDLKFIYAPFVNEGSYEITIQYRDFQIHRSFLYQKNVD